MAHFTFTQVALLLPSNEALRMYEPAVANARAGCHKLTLGCFTEADATRAGLVPVRLALALSLALSLVLSLALFLAVALAAALAVSLAVAV